MAILNYLPLFLAVVAFGLRWHLSAPSQAKASAAPVQAPRADASSNDASGSDYPALRSA